MLAVLGYYAEKILGSWRLLTIYLLAGASGSIYALLFLTPNAVLVGSSTSVLAISTVYPMYLLVNHKALTGYTEAYFYFGLLFGVFALVELM